MEIFEQALRAILIQTNLVGPRVFLMRAPQKPAEQMVTPYIIFFAVGPQTYTTQRGPLDQQQRLYQISIFDDSQSRALAIADSLRQKLDTLRGDVGQWRIGSCFYSTQTSTWEFDTGLTHVVTEFLIMFRYLGGATATRSKSAAPTAT